MSNKPPLNLDLPQALETVEKYQFEPIKGYPMLNWKGKRPFTNTLYYPAQLKERHTSATLSTGSEAVNNWLSKIFWGDNLQVMSHLLKEFRGKINLVYIDPPFDSKADYKKKISLRNQQVTNDLNSFEEKQYTDIWTNDEYLQFMYERLILIRELLADDGSIYLHCDYHKSHYMRLILDEIFGIDNFINEIIWKRKGGSANPQNRFGIVNDTILAYGKTNNYKFFSQFSLQSEETQDYIKERFRYDFNGRKYMLAPIERNAALGVRENLIYEYKGYMPKYGWMVSEEKLKLMDLENKLHWNSKGNPNRRVFLDEYKGQPIENLWTDIFVINPMASERENYPTQKPEALLERIIKASSNEGDIVFDCFMGSGTTQAVAMKLGRRFIGADINLGAVQITTKRLLGIATEINYQKQQQSLQLNLQTDRNSTEKPTTYYTGFEVYNVNHYDIFRNPLEAKELLLEALEVQKLPDGHLFDGEKDGRMVYIMPVNRIATRKDLNEIIAGLDYKTFEKRQKEKPNKPVEKITLVCMGHEPDLGNKLKLEVSPYEIDVNVVDILKDRNDLQFKRDSEAKIEIKSPPSKGGSSDILVIEKFYPMNLLNKLSLEQEKVEDWRELVESIMIDFNYDGAIFEPTLVDIPDKKELVKGSYEIPQDAGTIKIKITDLLSESLELEVKYG